MAATLFDVAGARPRFSSLKDGGFVFLDAPGGSQVPDEVGDAIARTLREASANNGAPYETSKRVEAIYDQARVDAGRFLNCSPDDVIFGANMTTLDFMLTRTASRDWRQGDKILVSKLDHDGGVAPWVELAADRGFEVDWIDVTPELRARPRRSRAEARRPRARRRVRRGSELGRDGHRHRRASPSSRTPRARSAGSTASITPRTSRSTSRRSAATFFLCSPYKYCGPHLGVAYGRHELMESWRPYKARPAPTKPLGKRFETGTPPYELLAGFSATIAYLESLGGMGVLRDYERALGAHFLETLPGVGDVYGVPDDGGRVPTFLLNVDGVDAAAVATTLAEHGYGVWAHDNWYSLGLPFPYRATRSASASSTTTRWRKSTGSWAS